MSSRGQAAQRASGVILKGDERVGVEAFDESVEFTYRFSKAMGHTK